MHNGIIENFRELREELQAKGAHFATETDTEVVAHLVTDEMQQRPLARGGGRGRAAAPARRVRARVPVRGRGGSADRRAQGLAARGRLRQGRDVSRLRRDRARAVHRHDQLSGRRRLGGAQPQGRRRCTTRRQRRSSAPVQKSNASAFLVDKGNHRHFMAKEIHEQPEVVGHTLAHYLDMAAERVRMPRAAVRFRRDRPHFDLGLRHRLLRRADREILVRAFRAAAGRDRCRVRIPLPRGAVLARRARDLRVAVGRDRRHARDLALRQGAEAAHSLDRERADLDHRARKRRRAADARRSRDRRRLDQGVHLPACGARLPRDRGRPRARRPVRGRRAQAGARADRGAAPDGRGAARSSRRSSSSRATSRRAATCSISAAARPIRSRSKAR